MSSLKEGVRKLAASIKEETKFFFSTKTMLLVWGKSHELPGTIRVMQLPSFTNVDGNLDLWMELNAEGNGGSTNSERVWQKVVC